ncbi:MAG: GNAT family N-acetyltransferase [Treponema sp.]|jgi:predicted N-acyltransferase|nr:GNAT family N-acetyltransferase [Treponema sp.]
MGDKKFRFSLKIYRSVLDIPRKDWNSLVTENMVPFLEWEWLSALEKSGSICPGTGWYPFYFCLWEGGRLSAAAPFYLKNHSDGEYVWDYFWAEAALSLGRSWFPKLVGTLPATPAEGYRFLCAGDLDLRGVSAVLLGEAEKLCRARHIRGIHLLFTDPGWAALLPSLGYTPWKHSHYLWKNPGYASFEDYLGIFNKNQRKNIHREYRRHEEQGIEIRVIPGEEAGIDQFRRMFELFTITNDKFIPWDARWVNEEFFLELEKQYRRGTAFVEARRRTGGPDPEVLAMAFLVRKGDRVWGRFWGAYEEVRDLHFAVCYYAPMDWCIREGIHYFDPGAGSPHKIRRGFTAESNRSYHKFFDPLLSGLFTGNIDAVNRHEEEYIGALNSELPFKGPAML